MDYQSVFKRYEIKFLLTNTQFCELKDLMNGKMCEDKFGKTLIRNVYFDTENYLLVRRSLDKPVYKEKLRARAYGEPKTQPNVFLELKKKFDSVVYKRRFSTKQLYAGDGSIIFPETQIGKEIQFAFSRYQSISPKMFLSYEREAFYLIGNGDFRMTFDKNILWRDYDVDLSFSAYGKPILNDDKILLEVKTASAMPLWLTDFLANNKIYKTSFSKYGNAYLAKINELKHGGVIYA